MQSRSITQLGICRSFQIPQLFNTLSVHENLSIGVGIAARSARSAPSGNAGEHAKAEELLDRFNLSGYRTQAAGLLPEGVRKLLDIAMAVAGGPRVLLLDEPTSGVSAEEKFRLMDMVMGALQAERVTVLFVEHDMDIVHRYTPHPRVLRRSHHRRRRPANGPERRGGSPVRDRRAAPRRAQGGLRCCALRAWM
jgi:branched-chain amino acid transport system ATP-binding protein